MANVNDILRWLDYAKADSINDALKALHIDHPTQENLSALDSLWEEGAGYGYAEG